MGLISFLQLKGFACTSSIHGRLYPHSIRSQLRTLHEQILQIMTDFLVDWGWDVLAGG